MKDHRQQLTAARKANEARRRETQQYKFRSTFRPRPMPFNHGGDAMEVQL
jgi:hypothetical protein